MRQKGVRKINWDNWDDWDRKINISNNQRFKKIQKDMTTKLFAPPTFRIHINRNTIHPSSHDKKQEKYIILLQIFVQNICVCSKKPLPLDFGDDETRKVAQDTINQTIESK